MADVFTGILRHFDPGFYLAAGALVVLVTVSTVLLWLTYQKPG